MDLYRFNEAAIALDRVLTIKPVRDESGEVRRVRVYFETQRSVLFEGDEADAIREFIRRCPAPPEAGGEANGDAGGAEAGGSSTAMARDVATGKPLARGTRSGVAPA